MVPMDNVELQKKRQEHRVVFTATSAHLLTHAYMMIFPSVLILTHSTGLAIDSGTLIIAAIWKI